MSERISFATLSLLINESVKAKDLPEKKVHRIYQKHKWRVDEVNKIAYIPLVNFHRQKVAEAIIELDDLNLVVQYSYHVKIGRRKVIAPVMYAVAGHGINMHEIIMGSKSEDGYVIDHINWITLDNRRCNLRRATYAQNNHNRTKCPGKSSNYYGVSLDVRSQKWIARICIDGKRFNLGKFEVEKIAAEVYDAHAILFYGEHARTNGILSDLEIQMVRTLGITDNWKTPERKVIRLPDYVTKGEDGMYHFNYQAKDFDLCKKFKIPTLAECITLKQQLDDELKLLRPITRNASGVAVFRVYYDKRTKFVETEVDDDVWRDLSQHRFGYNGPYVYIFIDGKIRTLHTYIFQKYIGDIERGKTVDHKKSKEPLNNRVVNLRPASKALQTHNQMKKKDSVEKYKGINYMKGLYHVFINHQSWGSYKTEEEAAEAANVMFTDIYGSDARLNVIDKTKKTTQYNRIPDEVITRKYILSLKYVKDVYNIIINKKLNAKAGGPFKVADIKGEHLDIVKLQLANILFPQEL